MRLSADEGALVILLVTEGLKCCNPEVQSTMTVCQH